MSSGRITLEEALAACESAGMTREPVTASEVAAELGCTRRAALNKLDDLADRGDIESKKVGARSRVWWRPPDRRSGPTEDEADDAAETGSATIEGSLSDIGKRLDSELEEVFGRISDGFYALDDQWRFTYVSERAEELIDAQSANLVGENIWDVFEDVADTKLSEEYRTAMETQEPTSFEFYDELLDAWYEVHVYPSETGLSVYFRDVSERKQRERQLEESERRYRTLVEHFPNGAVALVDEDLRYRTVGGSPIAASTTVDDLESQPVGEVLPSALADDLVPRYEAAFEGERSAFESEVDDRIYQIHIVPVRDDHGDVFAALGMSQDVTESKEMERELRTTKERYQRLVEQNLLGIYLVQDGEIEYVNPRFADIFGYAPEEMLSELEPLDLVAPESRERVAENLRARQEGDDDSIHYAFTGVRKDGEPIEVEVHGSQFEHQGEPAVLGTLLDVTERNRMEAELRRERNLKDQIVETSPVGITVVGADGTIQFVNDRAEEIYGRSREEIDEFSHDDPRWDLVDESGDSLGTGEAPFDRVLASEEPIYDQVIGLRRPSGERVWVSVNAAPQRNEAGELERAVFAFEDVTERRETKQELRESERRYRTLVDNFPDGSVGLFDENYTYDVVGGELLDDLGLSRDDVVGTSIYERYPDDLVDQIEPNFRTVFEGESNTFEIDIDERILLARTLPVRNADDEIYAGMLLVQDVTESKERERELDETITELRESEERLKLALKAGEMGTWELDLQTGGAPLRSPQHDQIFGYEEPLDDWGFETFLDHVHPDDRERVERRFEEAFETGKWEFECRVAGADGEQRAISVQGEFNYDDEGDPVRAVGVVQDVSERKERERELERALDLLERTERIADVGGWEIDVNTRDVFWTDHIFDLLEVTADEEPVLDEALDMYYEEDQPLVEEAVEEALASGDPFDVEVRIRTDGGEMRWLRLQGVPETVDDEVVSFRGAAQDITEQVERERQLEETVEKLEESNDRLESFASMLAHELRNPVAIGQIYSQQLPDDTNPEAVEYVTEAFDRIEDMIDVLLMLTRGREAIGERMPVQLADAARDAWDKVEAPDATLTVESDRTIQTDETYVQHLFRNLFENAVEHGSTSSQSKTDDAMEHGGADVTITVGSHPSGFYVADDGEGIPPEERDAVFEAGYTTAAEQGGTGLGLAFVRKLADVYEWECTVTEGADGGARFEFANVDGEA